MATDSSNSTPSGLNPIVQRAMDRFEIVRDFESDARTKFLNDLKFAEADAYNGYQWPGGIRRDRELEDKPCLTINKTRQHNNQIINDAKQNKPGIAVRATGGGASFESAQVLSALIKHIEYRSNAGVAYDTAVEFNVKAGWGALRVGTDYCDEESFDQEILIERVSDPLTIYWDRDAKELDKSDSKYAFVVDQCPKDQFEKKYPKYKDIAGQDALGAYAGWLDKNHVMVAEYWEVETTKDVLYAIRSPQGLQYLKKSELKEQGFDEAAFKALEARPDVQSREIDTPRVMWYYIVGDKIVEEKEWPGKFIPLVPVVAEESVIEGKLDRKSHTRALLDTQRMLNYWASSAVEYGALQTKVPWLAAVEAVEGYEKYYDSANRINHAWLPFKSKTQDGQDIPPPQRVDPPVPLPVAITGMQIAYNEFGQVSGQYEPQMGQQGNERSGKAIGERQRQGDNATYHYVNAEGVAIRQIGRIILDLAPKIYDTRRVMQIMALDDQPMELIVDPQMQQAYEQRKDQEGKVVSHALNLQYGKYEVQADVGPGYATKREEAFEAFKLILTQNPTLTAFLGDILFRAGDFPHADEAAQRLRRLVPSYALGEGPSPTEQQLQTQVQQLTQLLAETMEELSKEKIKLKGKEQQRDIDVYKSFTERLRVLLDSKIKAAQVAVSATQKPGTEGTDGGPGTPATPGITADEVKSILDDLLPDLLNIELTPIIAANAPAHEANSQGELFDRGNLLPSPKDPEGIRRDFAGRAYGGDVSRSSAYRLV